MLNIYSDESFVPKGMKIVKFNDAYFGMHVGELKDDPYVRGALRDVESGKYFNDRYFIGQFHEGAVDCLHLSTGCKAAINTWAYPEVCVNLIECGTNAIDYIMLHVLNGNVVVKPSRISEFPEDRDICYNGIVVRGWKQFEEVSHVSD